MNTPSHMILNLAVLGRKPQSQYYLAIALGGLLPDVAIFVFFLWAKSMARLPDSQIWSEAYYRSFWQDLIAIGHSIPLTLMAAGIAYWQRRLGWMFLFLSMTLHSLGDLPVHNDDAHRHFFPFSHYRFISPLSYWDTDHYGAIVSFVEVSLVLIATVYLLRRVRSPWGKGLMIATNIFYLAGYLVVLSNA